jgi:hypothetical protein
MLSPKGKGLVPRRENLAKDFFIKRHNNKDGWKYFHCNHQGLRGLGVLGPPHQFKQAKMDENPGG